MAMPAAIIIRRSSGGRRGVLSNSFASASRSRTALRTARRKRSMVQRAPPAWFRTRTTSSQGYCGRMRRTVGSHRSIEAMTSPVKTRVSRRCGFGDGGGIPRPEARISWKLSARPRRLDARLRALGNQRPFELRDRAKDLERKHALGRRGVDGVAQRAKVGAALLQALDDVEEMADRAGEAVEADDDQNIAGSDFAHQSGELRPSARSARPVFLVNCRAARRAQLIGLRVRGLILGRDARVAQKTSCRAARRAGEGSTGQESLLFGR